MGATENARLEISAPCYRGRKMWDQAVLESQNVYSLHFGIKIRKSLLTQLRDTVVSSFCLEGGGVTRLAP